MLTLSKTPILSSRLFPLPKSIVHEQRNMVVGMLETVVDQGNDQALRIYNIHLSAKSAADRIAQIHTIRHHIHAAPKQGGAWTGVGLPPFWQEDKSAPPMPEEFIALGDFNLSPQDPEYKHLTSDGRNECGLIDCWTLTGHGPDEGTTFPTGDPDGGPRMDFAFVDRTMHPVIKLTWIDNAAQGSDHQPCWIETEEKA